MSRLGVNSNQDVNDFHSPVWRQLTIRHIRALRGFDDKMNVALLSISIVLVSGLTLLVIFFYCKQRSKIRTKMEDKSKFHEITVVKSRKVESDDSSHSTDVEDMSSIWDTGKDIAVYIFRAALLNLFA